MRLIFVFIMFFSLSCEAIELERLSFSEINYLRSEPSKISINDSGDKINLSFYPEYGVSGAKEKFIQCSFVSQKLHCYDVEPNLFSKKNNYLNSKCKGIADAETEMVESGEKTITIKSYESGDQTIHIFDSVTCKDLNVKMGEYNVKFLGLFNKEIMLFHYGYGGNWAGIMQYNLNGNLPPTKIEGAGGDERVTSFSAEGLLVSSERDRSHCFYVLSDRNFRRSTCIELESAEFEAEATVLSENSKYMAVSFYNNNEEKRYLAIYKLIK